MLCTALACPAAATDHYVVDHDQTRITFNVSNLGLSEITGAFADFDGYLIFSPDHPEIDHVSLTLYSGGIHATSGEADDDLQGPHFFDAQHFPTIKFVSTKVDMIDSQEARVTGDLTLLGITRPVTVAVHLPPAEGRADAAGSDAGGKRFQASMTIERSEFGMDYLSPIIIGEDVHIHIDAYGIPAAGHSERH